MGYVSSLEGNNTHLKFNIGPEKRKTVFQPSILLILNLLCALTVQLTFPVVLYWRIYAAQLLLVSYLCEVVHQLSIHLAVVHGFRNSSTVSIKGKRLK